MPHEKKVKLVVETETETFAVPEAPTAEVKPELVMQEKNLPMEPEETSKPAKRNWGMLLAGLALGIAIGAGGEWLYASKAAPKKEMAAVQPTIIPEEPSITPTPELLRSNLVILVQNGSGAKGAAAIAAETLKGLGYEVAGVANAKGGPYAKTQIQVKEDGKEVRKMIEEDLAGKYVFEDSAETLENTATADAILIVGKK